MTSSTRQLAAITFIDIVGYSTLMHEDEEQGIHLLSLQKDVVFPIITKYNGRIIKEMGDGLLVSFKSAIEAVQCSLQIQVKVEFIENLNYRIGIHLGDVIIEKNDAFGDGVNIASRIQHIADPGQVCISNGVYDAIQNHPKIHTSSLGKRKLKGIKEDIELFIASTSKEQTSRSVISHKESLSSSGNRNFKTLFIGFVFSVIIAVSIIGLFKSYSPVSDDVTIAILPFSNTRGDTQYNFLSKQFPLQIIAKLSRVDNISIKDYSIVSEMYSSVQAEASNIFDISSIRKVGKELNSKYVIYGSYLILKQHIRVICLIVNIENVQIIDVYENDYDISEIRHILNDLPDEIEKLVKSINLQKKANPDDK